MELGLVNIKRFMIGTLIGIASMLPGVSGAVIAVCFGVYERLIADVADIFHKWRSDLLFLALIGCGIVVGMVAVAFGLDYLGKYKVLSLFLFAGLIAGQLPGLFALTSDGTPIKSVNYLAIAVGILIMCVFLFLGTGQDAVLTHDASSFVIMIAVGIFLAISKLAPGISGSTVMLVFGLFYPLMAAITHFDLFLLLPVGIGLLIGLLGFSKVVNYAINSYRKSTYFVIFGLTIGSLLVIFKDALNEALTSMDMVYGMIAVVVGIAISLWFVRLGNNNKDCQTA